MPVEPLRNDGPEQGDVRPWEFPGAARRDCEPHRAEQLGRLADYATGLGLLSVVCCVPAMLALPLAFTVLFLAQRDLHRMAAGAMDHEGQHRTREVMDRTWRTVFCTGAAAFCWIAAFLLYGLAR